MYLNLAQAGLKFYFLDAELALYRVHPASVQKAQNDDYFGKYLISRDYAFSKIILPNLPVYERYTANSAFKK